MYFGAFSYLGNQEKSKDFHLGGNSLTLIILNKKCFEVLLQKRIWRTDFVKLFRNPPEECVISLLIVRQYWY